MHRTAVCIVFTLVTAACSETVPLVVHNQGYTYSIENKSLEPITVQVAEKTLVIRSGRRKKFTSVSYCAQITSLGTTLEYRLNIHADARVLVGYERGKHLTLVYEASNELILHYGEDKTVLIPGDEVCDERIDFADEILNEERQ